jgi:hypothetical protein
MQTSEEFTTGLSMGDAKTARAAMVGWACLSTVLLQCGQVRAADPINATAWYATLLPAAADPLPAAEPAAPENASKFQLTAREWLSAMSKLEARNNTVSTTQMYLYGGSLAYVPAWESGVTFLLTAYYGVSFGYSNFQDFNSQGSSNLQRLDVEALVKVPIGTTPAYGAFGVRYIDFKRHDTATATGNYVGADSTIQTFSIPYTRDTDYKYYLGEIGVGNVTALDESGKHRMFGGVMFVGGAYSAGQDYGYYDNDPSRFDIAIRNSLTPVIGMDTHFGYAYSPWDSLTISMRYRAFVMADLAYYGRGAIFGWGIDYSHYSLVHGPEFNLAYQF